MIELYAPVCSEKSRAVGAVAASCVVSAAISNPGALTSTRYGPDGAVSLYVPSPLVRAFVRNAPQRRFTVAPTIGAPLGSVKAWIRRGLEKLKGCLMGQGVRA